MLAWCWTPIIMIGVLHYSAHSGEVGLHNVLRRVYYLPIIVAAFHAGLRGGVAASAVVSITYLPHAFMLFGHTAHMDPAGPWEKALEIVLFNTVGLVAGYLATLERRRADELQSSLDVQRALRDELVKAGRLSALGELIAGVTHEIKTPLHALRGTAEIVDAAISPTCPQRRMWELHRSEIERLGGIAERFQSFARPEPGEMIRLDLNAAAARLGTLLAAAAKRNDVEVEVERTSELVIVEGDRDQLAQVGLNIAMNAMHALGDRGGRIRVSARHRARSEAPMMHALVVENDGPPIPQGLMDQLFDPFVSGTPGGSGLGLSIAARIVALYGGFIEASNSGLGVTFIVFLPAAGAIT